MNQMKNKPIHFLSFAAGWISVCAIALSGEPAELASKPEFVPRLQPVQISFAEIPPAPEGNEQADEFPDFSEPELIDPFAERVEYDPSVREPDDENHWHLSEALFDALSAPADPLAGFFSRLIGAEHHAIHSPLHDHAIGLQTIPERPPLAIEWGEKFLAPGRLEQGIETGTGAVWRPALWVWGEMRTGYNYIDVRNAPTVDEVASRLDLFAQLNLSGTERILLGVRPLDEERWAMRRFSSYDFENDRR
ncbi:MAG TPA: hypothetical protein VLA12_18760, partial [Planctomycetaceae bacterium]|nr:hypothetical protein [Planctomycetaceae bacterium]